MSAYTTRAYADVPRVYQVLFECSGENGSIRLGRGYTATRTGSQHHPSARLAGLELQSVTAECLRRTCKELGQQTVIALVQDALANRKVRSVRWKRVDRDVRLHGIGRRSG